MRYSILAISVLLSACGRGINAPQVDQGEFAPYVETFIAEGAARGLDLSQARSIPIEFNAALESTARSGECALDFSGRRIHIKESTFHGSPRETNEFIVTHELGHCVLDLGHVSAPEKIMFGGNVSGYSILHFINNRSAAYDEFFSERSGK